MKLERWREQHKDSRGIDYIMANIQDVQTCELGMVIRMRFRGKTGFQDNSTFILSYYNPDGCYRISEKGKICPFRIDKNTKYTIDNRSFCAETLVCLGRIFLSGVVMHNTLQGMCGDVLDGSGTLSGRSSKGLRFNISPSNVRFTTRTLNSAAGQH